MASDYEPAQSYAERRGITFRERVERVVEIVKQVPEKVRGMFDGLRLPADGGQGRNGRRRKRRRKTRRRLCAAPAPRRSSAMPAPWMRSSRRRSGAAGPARSR
jgi:hypothetical protein